MTMTKRNLLITGLPGVGKTTLIKKVSEAFKDSLTVGFYTEEIRGGGGRRGFELVSLGGKRGLLAHQRIESPYKVGPYGVDVKSFEDFLDGLPFPDPLTRLMIIDEIGKMECFSGRFRRLMKEALDSEKWVIATIASKGGGLIAEIKERQDIKLFEITKKNRDSLLSDILKEVEMGNGWRDL